MYFYTLICVRIIGFIISIGLIGWGISQIIRWQRVAKHGIETTGTIIKLTAHYKALLPTVSYMARDGQTVIVEVKHNLILRSTIQQGVQISIKYNPANLHELVILSELGGWYYPLVYIMTGIFLVGWLVIT